jgi:predicted alpha/beta-fold hydrolase
VCCDCCRPRQNAHLQTVFATGFRRAPRGVDCVTYIREHAALADGGELSLDWDERVVLMGKGEGPHDAGSDDIAALLSPIGTAGSGEHAPHLPDREDVTLVDGTPSIRADMGTVILLHGLTGGSQEKYVVAELTS